MPTHEYRLQFDEALMLSAVGTYVRREAGWMFIAMLAGLAAVAAWLIATGDRSWMLGVLAATLGFGIAICAALYRTHRRRARDVVRRLRGDTVAVRLDERGVHYASTLGTTMLEWTDVARLTRTRDYWLLHFRQGSFATLPTAGLDEAGLRMIETRVRDAGGKVDG